jgi:hypothetical protein
VSAGGVTTVTMTASVELPPSSSVAVTVAV